MKHIWLVMLVIESTNTLSFLWNKLSVWNETPATWVTTRLNCLCGLSLFRQTIIALFCNKGYNNKGYISSRLLLSQQVILSTVFFFFFGNFNHHSLQTEPGKSWCMGWCLMGESVQRRRMMSVFGVDSPNCAGSMPGLCWWLSAEGSGATTACRPAIRSCQSTEGALGTGQDRGCCVCVRLLLLHISSDLQTDDK